MKKLIIDNNGHKTYITKTEVLKPKGYFQIEFSNVLEDAKYPETSNYRVVLSPEELNTLKETLFR
jgi:hypothetical protein